jgi:integrase
VKQRTRTQRGRGSIYPDGAYFVAAISVGSGKHRRRLKVKTRSEPEAVEALRRLHAQHGAFAALEDPDVTLEGYLTAWLEDAVRPGVRATTYDLYESVLRNHVYPRIGAVRLDRLREPQLVTFFRDLERDDVGPRLREIVYLRLKTALDAAIGRVLVTNPMAHVRKPRVPRRSMTTWTAEQARAFLAGTAADELGVLYRLALSIGGRRGELLALRRTDFDRAGRRLRIQHTLSAAGELLEPKTPGARRAIDLPGRVVDALVAHIARLSAAGLGRSAWLFPVETKGDARRGEARLARAVSSAFTAAIERVDGKLRKADPEAGGLPMIRFHDLRHTAATLRLANGDHPKVVSEMLGHASIQITLDTYSHVLPSMQRDAADRFDSVL